MAVDKKVIDISVFNTVSSYNQIVNSTDGAILRAGYRGYGSSGTLVKDTKFESYYSGLKSAKSSYPVGVYWVTQAITTSEAKAEANYVYNMIRSKDIFFPIYLDSENGNSAGTGRADQIGSNLRTDCAIAFCSALKALGYKTGIYASDSWFVSKFNFARIQASSDIDSLWVAKYSTSKPSYVPSYDAWQYTSAANISGVSGSCDCSHFYKWWSSDPTPDPTIDISSKHIILDPTSYVYDGTAKKPSVTVQGVSSSNYTVSYSNNINVGAGRAKAIGKGNYTGSVSETFRIYPVALSDSPRITVTLDQTNYVYDGTEKKPNPTVRDNLRGVNLVKDTDYTVTYGANKMPGNGVVSITGKGNYNNNVTIGFYIAGKELTGNITFTGGTSLFKYTGSAITPAVSISGAVQNTDYIVSYSNNINAGIATVTCTGIGGYSGTLKANFYITTGKLSDCNLTVNQTIFTYDGNPKTPSIALQDNYTKLSVVTYTVAYSNNINASNIAKITITGTGLYTGSTRSTTFTILPKSIVGYQYTIDKTEFYYNGTTTHEATVDVIGLKQGTDYKLDFSKTKDVGNTGISIIGMGNYTDSIMIPVVVKYQPIQDCIGKFGYATLWSEYRVLDEKPLIIYTPDMLYTLVLNSDYTILDQDRRKHPDGYYLYYFLIKGLGGFSGEAEFRFRIILEDPVPDPSELIDDLEWNFGNLDWEEFNDDPETAEGDCDFGPLEPEN